MESMGYAENDDAGESLSAFTTSTWISAEIELVIRHKLYLLKTRRYVPDRYAYHGRVLAMAVVPGVVDYCHPLSGVWGIPAEKVLEADREALPLLGVTGGFIFILSSLNSLR